MLKFYSVMYDGGMAFSSCSLERAREVARLICRQRNCKCRITNGLYEETIE